MYDKVSPQEPSVPNQETDISTNTVSETNDKATAPIEPIQEVASVSNNDPISTVHEEVTLQDTISLESTERDGSKENRI